MLSATHEADDSLSKFFERPIYVQRYSWLPGSGAPLTGVFDPWTLFFENPRVINRICNYQLLNAKLKVKFMLNGNSFYYGRLMADYVPLRSLDDVTSANTLAIENAVAASQRMHLFLDPTTSQGGVMTLPFIFWKNSLEIPSSEWNQMGTIYLRELEALKHANAATTPVEITIAVWAEDVVLSCPTTVEPAGLVAQAGKMSKTADEYSSSPISNMASSVAQMAGRLASVPVIGAYARATQMAASSVGMLARVFGYSRPAILQDVAPMRPTLVGNLCNTDCGDPVTKLTVDSKQELSIDPRIFGADLGDELVISKIASIQSYLTQFPWTVARAANDCLFQIRVNPRVNVNVGLAYHLPACAFASMPFTYWRGTMRYRFQVVASGLHQGRLKIVYDPSYVNSVESNVSFTKVIDLANERDFTIDVAWGQSRTFLSMAAQITSATHFANGTVGGLNASCNGVLSVYVQNTLVSPNSAINNDISINVFVSACDDIEFAQPSEAQFQSLGTLYALTPQSEEISIPIEVNAPTSTASAECMASCDDSDHTSAVFFGEKIVSFRQLLRRYQYHSSYLGPLTGDFMWRVQTTDFPPYRGYSANALHTTSAVAPNSYNYVKSTLLHFLSPAFLGVRGGMRSKYIAHCENPLGLSSMTATRGATLSIGNITTSAVSYASDSAYSRSQMGNTTALLAGGAATAPVQQPVLELEFPYYTNSRFSPAKRVSGLLTEPGPFQNTHAVRMVTSGAYTKRLDRYVSVGEDFQLFFFQGCPPLYVLVNPA